MSFTAHNILLDNGEKTVGNAMPLLAETADWNSIKKTINLFYPQHLNDYTNWKVADLGCLEGGYSVEFARMGFNTVGIEAREENLINCNYVKSHVNLNNLTFIKDDARNICNHGKFDITFCYGLLYHLNNPVEFLKTLSSCTNKMLLLHTHYAPENDYRYSLGTLNKKVLHRLEGRFKFLSDRKNYLLSKITENEGYKGRWFDEYQQEEKNVKIEKMLWASYNNYKSFWLLKEELVKALHLAGFNSVYEQFDYNKDLQQKNFTYYYSRSMFVAIKH